MRGPKRKVDVVTDGNMLLARKIEGDEQHGKKRNPVRSKSVAPRENKTTKSKYYSDNTDVPRKGGVSL